MLIQYFNVLSTVDRLTERLVKANIFARYRITVSLSNYQWKDQSNHYLCHNVFLIGLNPQKFSYRVCTRVRTCAYRFECAHTHAHITHATQNWMCLAASLQHVISLRTILPLSWFHNKGGWWTSDYYISQQKEEDIGIILTSACHPGLLTLSIAMLCTQWITTANIQNSLWTGATFAHHTQASCIWSLSRVAEGGRGMDGIR